MKINALRSMHLSSAFTASCCLDGVYGLSKIVPSPATLMQMEECVAETMSLEELNGPLQMAINKEPVASYVSVTMMAEVPLTTAVFMDFAGQPAEYENDCTTDGGVYRKLDFDLSCTEFDNQMQKTDQKRYNIIGLPRCYGATCGTDHDPGLFEEYTLLSAVEALNAHGDFDKTWQCVGMLADADDIKDTFCEIHDVSLKENVDIQSAYYLMATRTNSALDSGKSVGIAGMGEYQSACEMAGGTVFQQPAVLSCTEKRRRTGINTRRDKATFVATNFPQCIPSTCEFFSDDTASLLFEQFLRDSGSLIESTDTKWTCQQGVHVNENLPFFQKVKVQFQENPDMLYSICGGLALSTILIAACCFWSCGSSSASPEKKEASSSPEEHEGDNQESIA